MPIEFPICPGTSTNQPGPLLDALALFSTATRSNPRVQRGSNWWQEPASTLGHSALQPATSFQLMDRLAVGFAALCRSLSPHAEQMDFGLVCLFVVAAWMKISVSVMRACLRACLRTYNQTCLWVCPQACMCVYMCAYVLWWVIKLVQCD